MHKNTEGVASGLSASTSSLALPLLVVALCFGFNFIGRGVGDTYMVFLLPLGAEFGWQRSQMTSVYSALMVVGGLASPLSGLIFERWGPRVLYAGGLALMATGYTLAGHATALWHFYFCVSLLGGLGASALGMVPASALISRWFERRMSTAIGLAYAGFGCGALFIVPLVQTLIDGPGWRAAYHWIGGILVVLLPLSLVLPWGAMRAGRRPVRLAAAGDVAGGAAAVSAAGAATAASADDSASAAASSRSSAATEALRRALRDRRFWLMVQVMFFTAVGMYLIIVQSVAYLVEIGLTPLKAAGAFGSAGMLSVLGVSGAGWLADRFGYKQAATLSFCGTFCGTAVLFLMSYQATHWLLGAYVLLFGLCQGARGPLVASLSARHFPGPGQAAIYGAIYACMSVGSGLGALLAGVLYDLSGGYRAAFLLSMACVLLAAAPFWLSDSLQPPPRPGRPAA